MVWSIKIENRFKKELSKLDKHIQKQIISYLKDRILNNPRDFGKPLSFNKIGLWRYRVGDYRIICKIEDMELVVLVLTVAHRKNVYNK